MYIDGIVWFKSRILTSSCLMFLLARLILIVDSAKPGSLSTSRQMCTKLQSMLSFGKYQTSQISSNVTYASRFYALNFLAYSSVDDLLIFIEPKLQIHVYNAQTIQSLVNLTTTDVVIVTSTTSLVSDSRHDLYFIYETHSETNVISLRVCQVRFNMLQLNFENNYCIETIHIQYDQPNLRINGFTIKRDHAGTKKSLLFISTDIGLVYAIFDTRMGSLVGETTIMNETLNEGSIVLSSSNTIYYASKQEHLIYELHVQRDFRLRYGKIIKTNAIKHPFGLITDECNHLYIATRSMILVMYVQNRATIRSVFSKASDLPITLERLNSTTYVYSTIRKQSGKTATHWMFNFLYFSDPERTAPGTRHPVVNWEEKLDFNDTVTNDASLPILWPLSYRISSNTTKIYTLFTSAPRKRSSRFQKNRRKPMRPAVFADQDLSSTDENKYSTANPPDEQSINSDRNPEIDDNLELNSQEEINQPLDNDLQSDTHSIEDKSITPIEDRLNDLNEKRNLTSNQNLQFNTSLTSRNVNSTSTISPHRTIEIAATIFSEDEIHSYLEGRGNLTSNQQAQIQAYLAEQSSSNNTIFSKYLTTTKKPTGISIADDNTSMITDTQSPDSESELLLSDSKSLNRTINIAGTIFTEEDIQSYLQGRANLSATHETQLQAYLAQQLSSNNTIFPGYSKSTTPVTRISVSHDESTSEFQDGNNSSQNYSTKHPSSDFNLYPEHFHHIIHTNGTLLSNEQLLSYLEGRSNLSADQETLIEAYLARQSSSFYNIFSRYFKSTTKPSRTVLPNEKSLTNFSINSTSIFNEKLQLEVYLQYLNSTTNTSEILFSYEDLKSYLQGNANISVDQETQIQAYLSKQSSSSYNLSSKDSASTRKPRRTSIPRHGKQPKYQRKVNLSLTDDTELEDYSDELLPYYNHTIEADEIFFTEEEVQSYLQGRANLSLAQEVQIQAYLAKQLLSSYSPFSKYATSTKKPRRIFIPGRGIQPEHPRKGNLSLSDDIQSEDYSEEIVFSEDDVQSYLQRRANLSSVQQAQIQAYLAKQSSSSYNILFNGSTSTRKPRRILIPGRDKQPKYQRKGNLTLIEDAQVEDYSEELLPSDRTSHNRTTDTDEMFFTEEEVQSYLQGRANLSLVEETQIQAYLSKQPISSYSLFSKYLTSTRKPRRISIPNAGRQSDYQRKGNLSLTEDVQLEDYSEELLPSQYTPADNHRTDAEEIIFSDDDLRSYLEGRANLSESQETKIQVYLSKQLSSNQNIFSKYRDTTKLPARINGSDSNTHPDYRNEDIQSQNYLTKAPLFGSKYYNFSTDLEEILFSEDDLQSYIQGRANFSLVQEAQIQAYLEKQTSLDNNNFSRYWMSTRKPTKTSTFDEKLQRHFERQTNLSLNNQMQSSDATSQKLTSVKPYTTRRRTGGRRPIESGTNDTDDFDASMEQLSSTSTGTSLKDVYVTSSEDTSDVNAMSSTLSLNDKSIIKDYSSDLNLNPDVSDSRVTLHPDDDSMNLSRFPTTLRSTSDPRSTQTTPQQSLPTGADPSDTQITVDQTQISSSETNDTIMPSVYRRITSFQNQSSFIGTSGSDTEPIHVKQTSTLRTAITDHTVDLTATYDDVDSNDIQNEIRHKHSSPLSVVVNVSSTPHPLSPLDISSTTLSSSHRSHSSTRLHHSLVSPKFIRSSTSKFVSETTITTPLSSELTSIESKPTTVLSYSTIFPSFIDKLQSSHQFSSMQTTNIAITSNTPKRKSMTTLSDSSSTSPPLTTYEQSFTSKSDQDTSTSSRTPSRTSSEQPTRRLTTLSSSTNPDFSSTKLSDKTSSRSVIISVDEENLGQSDNRPLETTEMFSLSSTLATSVTDKYQKGLITTERLIDLPLTIFPPYSKFKTPSLIEPITFDRIHPSPQPTLPIFSRSSYPSRITTTTRRHRTRKQKITRWRTRLSTTIMSSSSTTTTTPLYLTTTTHDPTTTTSTGISVWHSQWNPLDEQKSIVTNPPSTSNDSSTLLTNDLLNKIFNNFSTSSNSSEKSIFFNLANLPPSSWNLSLNTNESVFLDIALPNPTYPSSSKTTTNLTFTSIAANRFTTNIIGIPINFQVDRVEARQFSLIMNTSDNFLNRNHSSEHLSDVIIGHVKSEKFELNLTKSDKMHVHVKQVDSATAELYLDSNFCTNESTLEINLNLSKNGTIRYGNRKPIHIGPVFTRVHMLKQSCDREQPLILFFDICERQNPCSNGGTCVSILPDYNDASYIPVETGHVGYKCHCPLHSSGEHCQHLRYPLGYCLNGGSLLQILDRSNRSIEKCLCPLGFLGEHCEENFDNCIGISCSDHGICEDGIETYKCLCYEGFYGFHCERTNVQTVLLQAASRSFGVIAILLIAGIAGLVVASDIHTYLTRKNQKNSIFNHLPRATSELFENSVLLLGFVDAPIEMNDLSHVQTRKKPIRAKQRQVKRTTRYRRTTTYRQITRRRQLTTFPKPPSRRYLLSG